MPSNVMARAASATPEEYFLGSSQEKRTVTALTRRGETGYICNLSCKKPHLSKCIARCVQYISRKKQFLHA
jgi:hypothetical protein